jgi:hypothetical protein
MGEQNDEEQREERSQNATQQPELPPSQDEQPSPARATGWRQARFVVTESVCSQDGTSRRFEYRHRSAEIVARRTGCQPLR